MPRVRLTHWNKWKRPTTIPLSFSILTITAAKQ
nr:MAG TPA: hypothetical protein [Caudoviricetes sp.]